ncbi:MAG: response regulator [Candidatus Thiodiazotropha lotti]|nr:response regulator [Candidatus Thiodiazotropha lotti]MCG7999680.1 response regulator [Candidatus Thiodiazotropha lotti]MCW4183311.1 response regulator [Candidatus Thiodiazotropha weberae]MCW4191448.1 response regulator [Candidatus Thiodiazotropha weberae]
MNQSEEKKRILFVDDEGNILSGLRRSLRAYRKQWDMLFVDSGQEALSKAEETHIDAVITDMRMPGMDGAQLLDRIAQRHPHVVRIVLSGQSDQETVMKTVGPAHQYLNKPCEVDVLKAALVRAFSLRDLLGKSELNSLISGMRALPSLPTIYNELVSLIQDPNTAVADIGRLIAKDPAMTVKTLQLVNSAFFGLGRHISNPVDAASLLGMEILKPLVLSIGIFQQFDQDNLSTKEFSLDSLWAHSMKVGSLAKQIANRQGMEKTLIEDCLLSGMLHDIGKLILALNLPEEYSRMELLLTDQQQSRSSAEAEIFGATHGTVGAYLLGLWGLPESVVEAVALHNQPSLQAEATFSPLTIVHVANGVIHQHGAETPETSPMDRDYLQTLGMLDQLDQWQSLTDGIES